jgi:hypothetical protein
MKKPRKGSALDRRQFLAATGGLLATSVPGAAKIADAIGSTSPHTSSFPTPRPSGALRKIPIGVFDPVYDHLSLDAMLDRVTALGLEAMEIGTGGYPNNHHCPLD